MSKQKVNWRDICSDDTLTFEDPITGAYIWVQEYNEIYGPLLESIEVSTYFSVSPVMTFHWEFIDHRAKDKFYAKCQKMDLIPELTKIKDGTWNHDQTDSSSSQENLLMISKQMLFDNQKAINRPKKNPLSQNQKSNKIKMARLQSIKKIEKQLENEENPAKINKLLAKLAKIKRQIAEDEKIDLN